MYRRLEGDPMSVNGVLIFIAGVLTLGLGVFHIPPVWRLFFPGWSKETAALRLLHRKLIDTVLLALALMLFLFAFISIGYPEELARAHGLAGGLAAALAVFWLWRAVWQLAFFPPSKIEHNTALLALNYSVVAVSVANAVFYSLPFIAG
jgi:hypothetical protein